MEIPCIIITRQKRIYNYAEIGEEWDPVEKGPVIWHDTLREMKSIYLRDPEEIW